MADSMKRTKKRKIRSGEDEQVSFKAPRVDQFDSKSKEPNEDNQHREASQNLEEEPPWRNLQLILSLRNKDIDNQKVDLAYSYVKLRVSEEADQTSQKLETVSHSRAIVFLNNWIQTLLISSEKKTRGEGDKPQFGITGSFLDYRCWEIFKFSLEESLKLNVSLGFSKDFLRVIQCIGKDALSHMSASSVGDLGGKEIELYNIALDCISSVFSSHGGVSNENLDLWILTVGTVLELVKKIVIDKSNSGKSSIFALQFSCVVLEPFTKFLRVHPTRKNGFHDLIDKLLEPLLHLLDVLHLHIDGNSVELTRNLLRLLEEVLSQGLFHPVHIDGFMGIQSTSKYNESEDGKPKDSKTVIKSYHRHLFDKLEKIVAGKHSMALGGVGELYRLYVLCLKKQRGVSEMNAETRKALFDFFVQIMEPLLHEIDTHLHAELEIGPVLLDVHCILKSANKVLLSFMHEKVYIRTEDTSEGALANFLKVVYDMIISFSAKIIRLLPSTFSLEKGTQKEVLNLIAMELIVAVRYLMEIEYNVVGDDLESLWLTMFSYAALCLSYMDLHDQSLLISEILHLGCQLINLYSELRQVNSSVFALCKAVRRLVLSVQDHQMCYAKSTSSKPSMYNESCAKLLGMILCSQELRFSIYNAIKSIPEGQANGCIRNLTADISETLEWIKADVENPNSPCFELRAELLGRGLSEVYTLILDTVTVTTGNSVLVGVSVKDLMAAIRPSMSSLAAIEPDGVYNFLSAATGKTFKNEYWCSHWFVLFFFRLYMSLRSLHRQIISLVPPQTSKKMSDVMGDSFTAYSGKDWLEKTGGTNEGYFSWIAEPSASLLAVAEAVLGICLKETVTNCSALIYVLNAMALQRLVDLNRLIKSFEYLVQGNDNLISSKLADDAELSLDRKKSKKWKRRVSDLREEAAGLTTFMMGYLPLVANSDRESISSPGGATRGNMSPRVQRESDAWDFGVGALDDKSLPSAIWWLICQNINIWSIHAAKKKLKMFLSFLIHNSLQSVRSSLHDFDKCSPSEPGNLKRVSMHQISFELLSDAVLYEQRFVRRHMASSFCQILEEAVSPLFSNLKEVDLKSPPDWTEVLSALENSSVGISEAEPVCRLSITQMFTSCQSLLNFLCWMPKEYPSCRSFSLYTTCILNFERLLVGSLLNYHGALHSSDHFELFRLFMSCRRALNHLKTASSQEKMEANSFPILWLLKSLSAVVSLQHPFAEESAAQVKDIIFSLMDHTSYVFLTLCKYLFTLAIRSSIFDRSEDIDEWKTAVLVAEALSESTQNLLIPLKDSLNGKTKVCVGVEELKKASSVISCFQGFLWGLASALDHIAKGTFNLKMKLTKGKNKPLCKINLCIDMFADFVSQFLRVLVLEDDSMHQALSNAEARPNSESCGDSLGVKTVEVDGILSQVDLSFKEKNLKKSFLWGFLRGEYLEAAFFLRQLFITSAAIIRLDLHMNFTSFSPSLVPIFIGVSQALLLEFANNTEAPHPFSFVWLDGIVKFLEELGIHFSSSDSTSSTNLYAKLIDLHLRAIGKCISLQGKGATLASHGTELSTKTLNTSRAGVSESIIRGAYCLDEFKTRLRISFKILVEKPSELHLLSAIEAIERAVVGVQEGCMVNYDICTGNREGGRVSSIVAAGVDCLDLIMEFVKGRKRLSMVRRHIQSLVACLFNIIVHLQGPQIFHSNVVPNSDPDSGAVILMCVEVLTRVLGKHALFQMHTCQIGQSLRIPSALFQNFIELRTLKALSQSNSSRLLDIKGTKSVENTNNCSIDRQFSVDLYAACCRLLCTILKHHKRESQLCIALIESSVRVLLHCLETLDGDSAVREGFIAWEVHDGVKCACFLRRIYEEIRQQKDIFGQHCFQFLSDYIWIYSGYGTLKNGIRREINEALRPGVYALIDACSPDDLQHIHTVFGEGPCRSTLASLQSDYKQNFQYEGKV